MTLNSQLVLITTIILLFLGFSISKLLFKTRKRSAESIYKLIDDLEKKYIY